MRTAATILTAACACCLSLPARAQQPPQPAPATTGPATPAGPAVRSIGQITSVSSDTFSAVAAAVQVGGRVLINDILARRVVLYDSTLARGTVVEDSEAGSVNAYGPRPGTLLPFRGDSALFIAPASLSMQVLSPEGAIARVMAMPPGGGGLPALLGNIFGTPGFDAHGRLAYYSPVRMDMRRFMPGGPGATGPLTMEPPDSAFVVRFDFATRTLDTAATIRIAHSRTIINRDESGRPGAITTVAFPPMTVDDWAVMSDGSIAVLRGRDYHIDWLNADGSWTSSPRLPFAWEHVNDEDKQALIDSTATAMQTMMDSMAARMERQRASGAAGPGGGVVVGGGDRPPAGGPPGGGMQITIVAPREGAEAAARAGGPGGPGGPTQTISIPRPTVTKATLAEVPDYRPPIRQGALRADAEGNLWIRTTRMVGGRPVYDVVNRAGQLVDRVQLPPFRTIAGFGPGVVYMGVRDSSGTTHLERARIR